MGPFTPMLTLRGSSAQSLKARQNSSSSASARFGLLGTHSPHSWHRGRGGLRLDRPAMRTEDSPQAYS
eukprot:5171899-Prymnesium_polylepis.1